MNAPQDEGATKVPEEEAALSECMGRWKHQWKWVWVNDVWTNSKVCGTCGLELKGQAP